LKFSTDYSPFGKFTNQILILTLLTAPAGAGIGIYGLLHNNMIAMIVGVGLVITGILIMQLGHRKQTIELFGPNQHWKDGLNLS